MTAVLALLVHLLTGEPAPVYQHIETGPVIAKPGSTVRRGIVHARPGQSVRQTVKIHGEVRASGGSTVEIGVIDSAP